MSPSEVVMALDNVRPMSEGNGGDLVHVWYESFGKSSSKAKSESTLADDLGLPKDHYTGRIAGIRLSNDGDLLVTMHVELERPGVFRTFNASKGTFKKIVVIGSKPVVSGAKS
jgi:hypothetical protein